MISIDLLSAVVASAALIISVLALVVAKREPMLARTRVTRDAVRDALVAVQVSFDEVTAALDRGRDVTEPPDAVEVAASAIKTLGPRLPEQTELDVIWQWLMFTKSFWREVRGEEESIARARAYRLEQVDREDEVGRSIVARYGDKIDEDARRRDAARLELREKMGTARTAIDAYLRRVNSADRTQRDI